MSPAANRPIFGAAWFKSRVHTDREERVAYFEDLEVQEARFPDATPEQRRARYRCSVVYLPDPAAMPVTFDGTCNGVIQEQAKGNGGFGYDPLFLSDELGITFGEATAEAKHEVSHRGRAFRAFAEWLARQS